MFTLCFHLSTLPFLTLKVFEKNLWLCFTQTLSTFLCWVWFDLVVRWGQHFDVAKKVVSSIYRSPTLTPCTASRFVISLVWPESYHIDKTENYFNEIIYAFAMNLFHYKWNNLLSLKFHFYFVLYIFIFILYIKYIFS